MGEIYTNNDLKKEIHTSSIEESAMELVNYLFKIFSIHIATFKVNFKNDEELDFAKQEWVHCFQKAALEKQDVINGANKLRDIGLKYMITPAEFIELCLPTFSDIGAPSLDDAFEETMKQCHPRSWVKNWSHEIVKEAYKRCGSHNLINLSREKAFTKFSQHYSNAFNDFRAGKFSPQIEHKTVNSATEDKKAYKDGKYEFSRPGVLKMYENVSSASVLLKNASLFVINY
jgi:Replication protein P